MPDRIARTMGDLVKELDEHKWAEALSVLEELGVADWLCVIGGAMRDWQAIVDAWDSEIFPIDGYEDEPMMRALSVGVRENLGKFLRQQKLLTTDDLGEQEWMNIIDYASKPGTLARFAHPGNGLPFHQKLAKKHLTLGHIYTIDLTDVGGSHTDVYLAEVPGVAFNSVLFAPVDDSGTDGGGEGKGKGDGMKEIWKRGIPIAGAGSFTLQIPENAQFLTCQIQGKTPVLWAVVRTTAKEREYKFHVFGTGEQFEHHDDLTYIGTFQLVGGAFVGHLFVQGAIKL